MDARVTKEEILLLLPRTTLRPSAAAEQVEAIRLAAARARDEAVVAGLRRGLAWLGSAARALLRAVAGHRERRRAMDELHSLSDRELADIGLNRGDIARVVAAGGSRAAPAPAAAPAAAVPAAVAAVPRRPVAVAAAANGRRQPAAAGTGLAKAA